MTTYAVTTTVEPTLESLQEEIATLRRQRLEERQQIVEIARRAAADNGLCEVVDRALTRAGLLGGEQVTIQANVPIQIVAYVDSGSDIPTVQAFLNSHSDTIQNVLAEGLGHVKAVSYGNARAQDARISLNGEIQVVTVEAGRPAPRTSPAAPRTRRTRGQAGGVNAWAMAPNNYLALYTTPQGRLVHFVRAHTPGTRNTYTVADETGFEWTVARQPLCSPSRPVYGFQVTSPRAERARSRYGICSDCRDRAFAQFQWQGPS